LELGGGQELFVMDCAFIYVFKRWSLCVGAIEQFNLHFSQFVRIGNLREYQVTIRQCDITNDLIRRVRFALTYSKSLKVGFAAASLRLRRYLFPLI